MHPSFFSQATKYKLAITAQIFASRDQERVYVGNVLHEKSSGARAVLQIPSPGVNHDNNVILLSSAQLASVQNSIAQVIARHNSRGGVS